MMESGEENKQCLRIRDNFIALMEEISEYLPREPDYERDAVTITSHSITILNSTQCFHVTWWRKYTCSFFAFRFCGRCGPIFVSLIFTKSAISPVPRSRKITRGIRIFHCYQPLFLRKFQVPAIHFSVIFRLSISCLPVLTHFVTCSNQRRLA